MGYAQSPSTVYSKQISTKVKNSQLVRPILTAAW